MAPTRGFRRVVVAVAATIIATRFFVRQPSESKPKPALVRTPTVRRRLSAEPLDGSVVASSGRTVRASRLVAKQTDRTEAHDDGNIANSPWVNSSSMFVRSRAV